MSANDSVQQSESGDIESVLRDAVLFSAYLVWQPSRRGSARDARNEGVAEGIPKFSLKDRVQIVGLRNYSHLNGSHGRVKGKSELRRCRWLVELEDDQLFSDLISVHEQNLVAAKQAPSQERCVLLHSLQDRKDLNGQSVFVVETDSTNSSRVIVRTVSNAHLSVPVDCTLLLPTVSRNSALSKVALKNQCCICLQAGGTLSVADPCGHTAVCEECSQQFAINAPCPVCREPVAKYIRIYN